MSAAGGATDFCHDNMLGAWPLIREAAQSAEGRALLSDAFMTCKPLKTAKQAEETVSSSGQGESIPLLLFVAVLNAPLQITIAVVAGPW